MSAYLVVIRNEALCLIGPFATDAHAANWAEANNALDDPRWQTVSLDLSPGHREGAASHLAISVLASTDERARAFMAASP